MGKISERGGGTYTPLPLSKRTNSSFLPPPLMALPRYSTPCTMTPTTTDFHSSSVYLITKPKEDCEFHLLMGYNKEYDNVCSFGGGAEPGETPLDTAIRETEEETNGKICSDATLKEALQHPSTRILVKNPPGGKTIYIYVVELEPSQINPFFAADYKSYVDTNLAQLPQERKENRELVQVPFSVLRNTCKAHQPGKLVKIEVSLADGPYTCELRNVCVDTCRWLSSDK